MRGEQLSIFTADKDTHTGRADPPPDLDEDGQAVVGVPGGVQVVFVLLSDVRHHHVDERLHRVVEGSGEALVPGQLQGTARTLVTINIHTMILIHPHPSK